MFQFDMWGVKPSDRWEWDILREEVKKHGVRNSLLLAPMPTASTAQILGNNECFEPWGGTKHPGRMPSVTIIWPDKARRREDTPRVSDQGSNAVWANEGHAPEGSWLCHDGAGARCFAPPMTSNIYTRRVLSGEFVVVNKYLLRDLVKLGLWSEELKNKIIASNGSVQHIPEIPQNLKDLYKTAWEISQKVIIDMAADRGAYICQSQSPGVVGSASAGWQA